MPAKQQPQRYDTRQTFSNFINWKTTHENNYFSTIEKKLGFFSNEVEFAIYNNKRSTNWI